MKTQTYTHGDKSITTSLTMLEARELLKKGPQTSFVESLLKSWPMLRGGQQYYFFKLAEDIKNPPVNTAPKGAQVGAGFKRVKELFDTAINNGLKRPKIKLQDKEGNKINFSLAPKTGKNPDNVYLKIGDVYCGRVTPEGQFIKTKDCPESVEEFLAQFSNDPARVAAEYGHLTGNCCFCSLELTDARSVRVGYGPICAGKYGLPWG